MIAARRRTAIALLALLAVVIVAYAPALDGPYLWDDHSLVERDEAHPVPLEKVFTSPFFAADPLVDGRAPYYRPLTVLSLRADTAVFGKLPLGHHFVNVLLHALGALLLVVFARRLGASHAAAVLGGAAWALAPRLTEAVAWISGRPDLLAGVLAFGALALWPWLPGAPTPRNASARAASSLVLLFAGLLAKEIALAAFVALAAATWLTAERTASRGRRLATLVAPLLAYGVLRANAFAHEPSSSPAGTVSAGTTLEAAGRYVAMTADPWQPALSIGLVGEVDRRFAALGALSFVVLVALLVRAWRRRDVVSRPALVAAALGLAGIVPGLRLVPLGLANAVTADRLLYFPLAGLVVALAVLAANLPPPRRLPAMAATTALVVSFAIATRLRCRVYVDDLTFWLNAAEQAHPHNTAPRSALANVVRDFGVTPIACELHASSVAILARTGRAETPRHTRAVENLASCFTRAGRLEEATALYAGLTAKHLDEARVQMGLGFAELQGGALDDAEASFRRALALEPNLTQARNGVAVVKDVRSDAARFSNEEGRRADLVGWANLAMRLGRADDARRAWLALAHDPARSRVVRRDAVLELILLDDLEDARAARAANPDLEDDEGLDEELRARGARHAHVAAVAARLQALIAGAKEGT